MQVHGYLPTVSLKYLAEAIQEKVKASAYQCLRPFVSMALTGFALAGVCRLFASTRSQINHYHNR